MHEATPPTPVIQLDGVVKIYRKPGAAVEVHALAGISLVVERGEYVAIVGASGSGKSTLMNILGCLDRPTRGVYRLEGRDVSQLDDDELSEIRGRRIGFIFQSFNLIHAQTVLENLETPLFYQAILPRERRARAVSLAERVGLSERLAHRPSELSGGQQQRVAIARALANDPAMLLADEPTGNLDSKTGQVVLAMLDELNAAGMTIVLVTHDPSVAARCKRVVEFRDGLIAADRMNALPRPPHAATA
ncbi:MAG: ABC transporter ATP-binding protein [Phycisphaerae bacterium]|jgi:putative ABC transport system ATP-binding protein